MRKCLIAFLCGLLIHFQVDAQNKVIKGRVSDESNNPIPNASVVIKGAKAGAVTDATGNYSISVPASATTLVVSSLNFTSQDVVIGGRSEINVTLASSISTLQDVVVVGYGTTKKATLTGSVATVKAAEIENTPFTSIDKALQGKVAGLQSVASSGQPGATQEIVIRGFSSISASNQPLWIVDGIILNTGDISRLQTTANVLSTLNPNDIESVTVLKDAASTSIYGSRGANGVILVTTKKGRNGKSRIRFDMESGKSDIAYENSLYRPLNAQEYLDLTREGLVNAGATASSINSTLVSAGLGNGIDFNWYDAVTRIAGQRLYNVSIDGGNDRTNFFVSAGNFFQEGTSINSQLKRNSFNFKLNNKATDRLTIGVSMNGGVVSQRAPLAGGAFGNPILSAYFLLPTRSAYNQDGSYNLVANSLGGLHNTVALSDIDRRFLREVSIRGGANAEYKFSDNLKFRSNYGIDYNTAEEDQYNNPIHGDGAATNGRAFSYYTRYFNWTFTNTLDYTKDITKNGDLSFFAQLGMESQKSAGYFNSIRADQFPITFLLVYPSSGASPITASATVSDYTFDSRFVNGNINFKNKVVVSGSFRRDGSSRFSAANRYGNFWSLGATWNMEKEKFMEKFTFINQLKLRSSIGVNGNAGIGNYDSPALYGYGANYNQGPGSAPSNVGDPNLTWELNKPFDAGIDLSILKNRVNVTFDYYIRKSEGLLLNVPLSLTSGFSTARRNIGSMENRGIEFEVNVVPVLTKNFKWDIDFNYAANKNKITSLPDGKDIGNGSYILRVGVARLTYYQRIYAGVDPANGDPLWFTDGTRTTKTNTYPGADSRALVGQAMPKYFGSITNNFSYKGFSISAQLYYNFGNLVNDSWSGYYMGSGFGATYNKVARQLNRWTKPGDITDIPRYVYNGNRSFQSASTFTLAQGDYIRLRDLQIGYDLPKRDVEKVKLSAIRVYMRGSNLMTWVRDKRLAFDPEQGTSATTNLNVFIPKTVTFGVNVTL
jgi:TonB-linked SusC/RagA family outer membrane protein